MRWPKEEVERIAKILHQVEVDFGYSTTLWDSTSDPVRKCSKDVYYAQAIAVLTACAERKRR